MNKIDLNQRVSVVTGGAQGIGLAIARRLVASGAVVSIWDKDQATLEAAVSELGQNASVRVVDVSDAADVEAASHAVGEKYGRIDILVANAGIAGPNHVTWEYPVEAWRQIVDINLSGVFYCCILIGLALNSPRVREAYLR